MPRGGARPNAGRKKAKELRKPICWRLTEDERQYLRKQLDDYRAKRKDEAEAKDIAEWLLLKNDDYTLTIKEK